jgi:hypothetical protein
LAVQYPNSWQYSTQTVGSTVPKRTIVIFPVPLPECLSISEPPDSFTQDSDEEKENATEETIQPSTSRTSEFSLKVTSPQTHNITQNEISDLIKELQLTNSTTEPFLQVYNSGIFWIKCES